MLRLPSHCNKLIRTIEDISTSDGNSYIFKAIWDRLNEHAELHKVPLILFGAGKFTRNLIAYNLLESSGPIIECILDDKATKNQSLAGIPVLHPEAINFNRDLLVFISSDNFISEMKQSIKKHIPSNQLVTLIDLSCFKEEFEEFETIRRKKLYQNLIYNNEEYLRAYDFSKSSKHSFSIIINCSTSAQKNIQDCLQSVINQRHTSWEIIFTNHAESHRSLKDLIKDDAVKEKVIFAKSNSGIAEASKDFVLFLDQYSRLNTYALSMVNECIFKNSNSNLIYTDEDKVENGVRFEPQLKPDWNKDYFYSLDYLGGLCVFRRSIIDETLTELSSQDYLFKIKYLEKCNFQEVHHIPYVLYHRSSEPEKVDEVNSGLIKKCLEKHFENTAGVSISEGLSENTFRVKWPIPNPLPKVSIIIPTRNRKDLVKACIDSILNKTDYSNFEIILIDNGSDERESLDYFRQLNLTENVRVLTYQKPFNYSAINNFAVEQADGSIIALVNNDIEVISPEWLSEMVSHASRKEIGCVGAKLYYPDKTVQHAGVIIGLGGVAGHSHKHFSETHHGYCNRLKTIQNYSAVTGACLVVEKEIYKKVGGLNEKELKIAFNDIDFCLKVKELGLRNLWTPYAELYHHESVSRGMDSSPEKKNRFDGECRYMRNRWKTDTLNDPCYNPSLTLDNEDFSIKMVEEYL